MNYGRADFEREFDCYNVYATERSLLAEAQWMILRKTFEDIVGHEHSTISPQSAAN